MKYYIKQMILGPTTALKIESQQFDDLKSSIRVLQSAKAIEEIYDLLIQNYLEFEQAILSLLAQQMIIEEQSHLDSYERRSTLNRRIINLLTSAKSYYDHIEKHVRTCMPEDETAGKAAKNLFSTEYDEHFEYQFMDALRNHVQHYGLAVHSLHFHTCWEGDDEKRKMANRIKIYTHKDEILLNKQFKKSILKKLDEKIDLVKSTRIYIGSLSNVHKKIRELINTSIKSSQHILNSTISDYESVNEMNSIGAYAYSVEGNNPEDTPQEKLSLCPDLNNIRVSLEQKNGDLSNLSRWYISSNYS